MQKFMTLTPEQFNKLATKDDLDKIREEMATKKELKGAINTILGAVDGLAKKVDDFHTELASNQAAHDRMNFEITSVKKRVEVLEEK